MTNLHPRARKLRASSSKEEVAAASQLHSLTRGPTILKPQEEQANQHHFPEKECGFQSCVKPQWSLRQKEESVTLIMSSLNSLKSCSSWMFCINFDFEKILH